MRPFAIYTPFSLILALLLLAPSFAFGQSEWDSLEKDLITGSLAKADRTQDRLTLGLKTIQKFYTAYSDLTGDHANTGTQTYNVRMRVEGLVGLMSNVNADCAGYELDEPVPAIGTDGCIAAVNAMDAAAIPLSQALPGQRNAAQLQDEQAQAAAAAPTAPAPPVAFAPGSAAAIATQAEAQHQAALAAATPPEPVVTVVQNTNGSVTTTTTLNEPNQTLVATHTEPPSSNSAQVEIFERAEEMGADPAQVDAAVQVAQNWGGEPPTPIPDATEVTYEWLQGMRKPLPAISQNVEPDGFLKIYMTGFDILIQRQAAYQMACEMSPPLFVYAGQPIDQLICREWNDSILRSLGTLESDKFTYEARAKALASVSPAAPQAVPVEPVLLTTAPTTAQLPSLPTSAPAPVVQRDPSVGDFAILCENDKELYERTYREAEAAHRQILTLASRGKVVVSSANRTMASITPSEADGGAISPALNEFAQASLEFEALVRHHSEQRTERMADFSEIGFRNNRHNKTDCLRLAAFFQSRKADASAFHAAAWRVIETANAAVAEAKGDEAAQAVVGHLVALSGQNFDGRLAFVTSSH